MSSTWKTYLLAFVGFLLGTSQFVVVGILDKIAASTGVSLAMAGQLVTVFSIANAIGTPVVMMMVARFDRLKVLMGALAVVVVSCVATPLFPSFGPLMASRAFLAVGTGVFYVTSMFVASKLAAPGGQANAIATIAMGFSASLVFGVPLGRLVAASYHWTILFWGIAACCVLALLILPRVIPSTEGEAVVPLGRQLAYLKEPRIAGALAIPFFLFIGYSALNTYIVPFMKTTGGLNESELNVALLAVGVASLIGSRLGGFLADRLGIRKTLLGGMTVQASALVLLATVAHSPVATFPLVMLWGVAAWTSGPTLYSNLIALAPEAAGVLMSMNSSIVQLGMAAGAVMGGLVAGESMASVGLTAAAAVAAATAIAGIALRHGHAKLKLAKGAS